MSDSTLGSTEEKKLHDLSKKIVEIKKKIQLSEGQRKANFEETETRKHENAEKIISLKKNIKELYVEYSKVKNNDDAAERTAQISRETSAVVRKRGLDEAIKRINEENIRLRKTKDLLRYQSDKLKQKLESLLQEHEKLLRENKRKIFKRKLENPLKKKTECLEVQLERIRMLIIKANIVRRKYKSVYCKLKQRSVSYVASLKELEDDIKEHENEMKRLRTVKEEAIELRCNMQEKLVKQEIEIVNNSNEQESIIQDYRQHVKERKAELERLERMIFPARPREDYDSVPAMIYGQDAKSEITKKELTRLEEAFAKLRNVTGVSMSEDILNRFLGQRTTKENLQKMRTNMEDEKMDLDRKRQELLSEIETRKFTETKNAEENAEETEKFNKKMEEERARQKKAETECERIGELLKQIAKVLGKLFDKLQDTTDSNTIVKEGSTTPSDPTKLLLLLNEIAQKLTDVFGRQDVGSEIFDDALTDKLETMSITTSLEGKAVRVENVPLFSKFPTWTSSAIPLSEDEEEVPTRNTLKRQAQLLVDTKSRRKGLGFKR
ncbi:meiosis-specific nuclear structural protein 1 [Vespula squamosa]|uniref:Meiosis-specific nuclear structural protein 1 n=1 Tax=Vespula squamosa TaxID=30214 RepID=A0ABD2ADE2_VESSQ